MKQQKSRPRPTPVPSSPAAPISRLPLTPTPLPATLSGRRNSYVDPRLLQSSNRSARSRSPTLRPFVPSAKPPSPPPESQTISSVSSSTFSSRARSRSVGRVRVHTSRSSTSGSYTTTTTVFNTAPPTAPTSSAVTSPPATGSSRRSKSVHAHYHITVRPAPPSSSAAADLADEALPRVITTASCTHSSASRAHSRSSTISSQSSLIDADTNPPSPTKPPSPTRPPSPPTSRPPSPTKPLRPAPVATTSPELSTASTSRSLKQLPSPESEPLKLALRQASSGVSSADTSRAVPNRLMMRPGPGPPACPSGSASTSDITEMQMASRASSKSVLVFADIPDTPLVSLSPIAASRTCPTLSSSPLQDRDETPLESLPIIKQSSLMLPAPSVRSLKAPLLPMSPISHSEFSPRGPDLEETPKSSLKTTPKAKLSAATRNAINVAKAQHADDSNHSSSSLPPSPSPPPRTLDMSPHPAENGPTDSDWNTMLTDMHALQGEITTMKQEQTRLHALVVALESRPSSENKIPTKSEASTTFLTVSAFLRYLDGVRLETLQSIANAQRATGSEEEGDVTELWDRRLEKLRLVSEWDRGNLTS